jgi:hypothetical protein
VVEETVRREHVRVDETADRASLRDDTGRDVRDRELVGATPDRFAASRDWDGRPGDEHHEVLGGAAGGVAGAVAGAAIGGPVGAVIGGAVGVAGGAALGEASEDDVDEARIDDRRERTTF